MNIYQTRLDKLEENLNTMAVAFDVRLKALETATKDLDQNKKGPRLETPLADSIGE